MLRLAWLALLAACTSADPSDTAAPDVSDADDDGYTVEDGDCDDAEQTVHPGATETWYDGVDQDCDGDDTDQDGDGYAAADDCDDLDPTVNPDGTEDCDGVDDDCDGWVDRDAPGALAGYTDADLDGHGAGEVDYYCDELPAGVSAIADDCDDTVATTYPGAPEVCDALDQDCDGVADEDATDAATFYADADADGHGDPAVATASCSLPTGYAAGSDDCDDADATTYPGAPESCDDADHDCDGDPTYASTDTTTRYLDADGDGYGDPGATLSTCEDPGGYVLDATDCDDADAAVNPVATEVAGNGADDDCDGAIDE